MDSQELSVECKEDDPWMHFSRKIGAKYVKGRLWERDKVVATVKNWIITFGIFTDYDNSVLYTRTTIRAPYVSKDGFQFKIYRKGISSRLCELLGMRNAFNELGKCLGMQPYIKVGPPKFERDFIIKSNNESKVRALFANSLIRQLIQSQPDIHLQLSRSELFFSSDTFIDSVARLKSLYELFKEILNHLSDIESGSVPD